MNSGEFPRVAFSSRKTMLGCRPQRNCVHKFLITVAEFVSLYRPLLETCYLKIHEIRQFCCQLEPCYSTC